MGCDDEPRRGASFLAPAVSIRNDGALKTRFMGSFNHQTGHKNEEEKKGLFHLEKPKNPDAYGRKITTTNSGKTVLMSTRYTLPPRSKHALSPCGEMTSVLGDKFEGNRVWKTHGSDYRLSDDERARQVYVPSLSSAMLSNSSRERERSALVNEHLKKV